MTVEFSGGSARTAAEIDAHAQALDLRLPADYRRFIMRQDGATPGDNQYDVSICDLCAVSRFIPIAEVAEQSAVVQNLPATAIPIAWAAGGNFVYLDTGEPGGVYFRDHEEPQVEYRLSATFEKFLERLEPYTPDDDELEPDVESVWINPDFLESLKK